MKKKDPKLLLIIMIGLALWFIYSEFNTPVQSVALPENLETFLISWQSTPTVVQWAILGFVGFVIFTLTVSYYYR